MRRPQLYAIFQVQPAINLCKDITQWEIFLLGKNCLRSSHQIAFNIAFTRYLIILFSSVAQILTVCKNGDDWSLLKLSLRSICQVSRWGAWPPEPDNKPKVVRGRVSKISNKLLREKKMTTEWSSSFYEGMYPWVHEDSLRALRGFNVISSSTRH